MYLLRTAQTLMTYLSSVPETKFNRKVDTDGTCPSWKASLSTLLVVKCRFRETECRLCAGDKCKTGGMRWYKIACGAFDNSEKGARVV